MVKLRTGGVEIAEPSPNLGVRSASEFIKAHAREYPVQRMCGIRDVAPSRYYERRRQESDCAFEEFCWLRLIRALDVFYNR